MIRKTLLSEVDAVMRIIDQAKVYFKEHGIDQWQNGYPNASVICEDVRNESSYVLEVDRCIVATMFLSFDEEKDYFNIEGKWLSDGPYSVIHRIAVEESLKGMRLADELLAFAMNESIERGYKGIRMDTHKDNSSMQAFLKRNGFHYCGIIYIDGKDPRYAYEKSLLNCE